MEALSPCVSDKAIRLGGRIPTFYLDTTYDTDRPLPNRLTSHLAQRRAVTILLWRWIKCGRHRLFWFNCGRPNLPAQVTVNSTDLLVFLVGVFLPAHAGAHAPHELPLELGVDELAGEGVAVAGTRPHHGAVVGAGELGGVLGAAELVLARVLDLVRAEVRLAVGRPSPSRIGSATFTKYKQWLTST